MSDAGSRSETTPAASSWRRGWHRLRNYFLTGLVIAAPLFLTVYITRTFVGWIDGIVVPLVPPAYRFDEGLPFAIPGFGVLVALVFITLLGFLTANFVGRRALALGESLLDRTPLIRTMYRGLKQVFETVISRPANAFQQVALLEFPRKGLWSIVFVAREAKGAIGKEVDPDDDAVGVFLPKAPNPTNGYLVYVKRSELVPLDISIEDAAKMIISAGLVTPEILADREAEAEAERMRRGARRLKRITQPPAA
jgi:uncharacterized membrane protein